MHHAFLALFILLTPSLLFADEKSRKPNVVLIITDDQGHGDLGFHGNPKIKTPNINAFAKQSVQLTRFFVSPVCSPTRASLLTGRYNYRTGVVDTYLGRSMMYPDEVTLAEMLGSAGYRCGIFGKWHLGDNYPMRAIDQGFHEALVCRGGGIGQPADPPDNHYTDPILQHNGKAEKMKGYCSDIFTDAAMTFITVNKDEPFFTYLAFNCPHTPLEVQEKDVAPYLKMNLGHDQFPKTGHPLPGKANEEEIAKVYGMVTNIDDNLGRLFKKLDELKLADDTIVIFMTDNGPQQVRWNSGLKDRKGSVYEGGIRGPCFVRWPRQLQGGMEFGAMAAHIDIVPTLLEACGVPNSAKVTFDGMSLLPFLLPSNAKWPQRTLYFQWHRGDEPELYRAFAARSEKWKLVQAKGAGGQKLPEKLTFELYDMAADPLEEKDVAEKHPDIVAEMKKGYEAWFKDVGSTRGYAPPRIHLGAKEENPVILTRQDWRGPNAGWKEGDIGYWEVEVTRAGVYDITIHFIPFKEEASVGVGVRNQVTQYDSVKPGTTVHTAEKLELKAGSTRIEAGISAGKEKTGATYVEVKRRE